ncbi:MAG TPA: hypothetical protein VJB97_02120 [Candidatus Paceibacterota bacterium]
MITAILNKVRELYAERNEPETERFAALSYWRLVVVAGALGLAGIVLYGVLEFNSVIATMNASSGDKTIPATSLDRAAFEKTMQTVRKRKADFEALKSNPIPAADPSR